MSLPAFPLMLPGMALPNESSSLSTQQATAPVSTWEKVQDAVAAASLARRILFSGWFSLRGVTMIIGLLLLAAAFFSHPAVREKIVVAGKTAGKAAALAA